MRLRILSDKNNIDTEGICCDTLHPWRKNRSFSEIYSGSVWHELYSTINKITSNILSRRGVWNLGDIYGNCMGYGGPQGEFVGVVAGDILELVTQ